jgi:DNA-binding response OmpR family regulator
MVGREEIRLLLLAVEPVLAATLSEAARVIYAPTAQEGFDALGTFDAHAAVVDMAYARTQARSFISDLRHPERTPRPNLPVVGLLSQSTPQDVQRLVRSGIDYLMVKPLAARSILQMVQHIAVEQASQVATQTYIGPDRRRVDPGCFDGANRRQG